MSQEAITKVLDKIKKLLALSESPNEARNEMYKQHPNLKQSHTKVRKDTSLSRGYTDGDSVSLDKQVN